MGEKANPPRIAVTAGDPAGIGPELVARLLTDQARTPSADLVVFCSESELDQAFAHAGQLADRGAVQAARNIRVVDSGADVGAVPVALASAGGGAWALDGLTAALGAWDRGEVDGLLFAPLNKSALHLAGMAEQDEMRWFESRLGGAAEVSELNASSGLWTSRVTSHVALREVADLITPERVAAVSHLLARYLRAVGVLAPRLAVCALNPHAGEGGAFGREEIDAIEPGIRLAREAGLDVEGPFPADTLFLHARSRGFDGVVTMFHDQGQIALKTMGFDGGVTIEAGLDLPICTPAHGSAYDIVGTGAATMTSMRNALDIVVKLAADGLDAA